MFHVVFQHGLGFTMKASSRKEACDKLMLMMGRCSLPATVSITAA